VTPLILLLAVWAASWTATKLCGRPVAGVNHHATANTAGHAVFVAAVIGLAAARLGYLARNAAPYLESPGAMLDLRDGGWHALSGGAAGAIWLVWRGWQTPPCRRPLMIAATAGLLVWSAGMLFTGARDAATLPATVFARLEDGQPLDLRTAAAGRPVVVNLWASWCGPCRQEMPTLAAAELREDRVGFIFVNQGETRATVHSYLSSLGLPLRQVLLDPGPSLGPSVGSRGLPTTLFYDAQGTLIDSHFGVLNRAALETRLRALRVTR
jgi:thiol-disulfide isomerase/thioredoxin